MARLTETEIGTMWVDSCERMFDKGLRAADGRMLLRSGAVHGLDIKDGTVTAEVHDSVNVCRVEIAIDPLGQERLSEMTDEIGDGLITGSGKLTDTSRRLMPTKDEVHGRCDCVEQTYCRHVAAVLFAIGRSIDADPELLLRIRGVAADTMLKDVLDDRINKMLNISTKTSKRSISDKDAEKLFRI